LLRRIFGTKREEVTEGWRKLHSKELHKKSSPSNIVKTNNSRVMRWAENITCMRENIRIYNVVVQECE
jgi:hypothetical protein